MSSSQDSNGQNRARAPSRPSLPALLSTVLLLMACCVRDGHGQQMQQQHEGRGLRVPLVRGEGPRLRARSTQHLKTWAANERLRINEKYGGIAAGTSSLEEGSSTKYKRKSSKVKRQNSTASTSARSTSGTISGASTTRNSASPSTTGLSGGSSSNSNTTLGRTNLTNYQSDLCVQYSLCCCPVMLRCSGR